MKKFLVMLVAVGLIASLALADPHMRKSVTAILDGSELTLQYVTAPVNMDHIGEVGVGDFRRGASLKVGSDLQVGEASIAAGEYTVGCVRDGENAWTMVLYPGRLGRREAPDRSKLIKLDSFFSTERGSVDHVSFDISPGSGRLAGRAVVSWRFGDHYLAGALS